VIFIKNLEVVSINAKLTVDTLCFHIRTIRSKIELIETQTSVGHDGVRFVCGQLKEVVVVVQVHKLIYRELIIVGYLEKP
jgi:hypothetical protein